jgi:hypothetical protein
MQIMAGTELPRHVKLINAFVLILMATLTIFAMELWIAWKVSPAAHSYGWNRFSYFTIQSNIIATITYLISALAILRKKYLGSWFRIFRGAAVLYMVVTAIVYALLLQDAEVNTGKDGFDWKNFVLHQLGPFFITVWWLLWPSRFSVSLSESLIWLIFPILWLIYTFVRASYTGWYPYPFLDPERTGGAAGVGKYIVGVTLGFIVLSQLLRWISKARENNNTLY